MKYRTLFTVPHLFSFRVVWADDPSRQAIDAEALRYIVTSTEVNKQIYTWTDSTEKEVTFYVFKKIYV